MIAVIEADADEVQAGALRRDREQLALESLRDHGAVVITGVVPIEQVHALRDVMLSELTHAASLPPALDIPGHVQHTPPPRARDLHRDIIANPIALSLARAVLGDVQLGLYTGNTMLGDTTEQQPVHWDYQQLWPTAYGPTPPAALVVNIPLVDVRVENGALEVWPGTHLDGRSGSRPPDVLEVPLDWLDARRAEVPPVRVPLPEGALLIRDGRLWHRGTTNTTSDARPMVAVVYHAGWFRPLPVDFYADAKPIVRDLGFAVTARFRDEFDHLDWPPNWQMVPKPV